MTSHPQHDYNLPPRPASLNNYSRQPSKHPSELLRSASFYSAHSRIRNMELEQVARGVARDPRHLQPPPYSVEAPWPGSTRCIPPYKLPVELRPFRPTRTLWITFHSRFRRQLVTVGDPTQYLRSPYSGLTHKYKSHVRKTVKARSYTHLFTGTLHRTAFFKKRLLSSLI